jgi:hypothetical protein
MTGVFGVLLNLNNYINWLRLSKIKANFDDEGNTAS